jgi:simple sugar transport system substrate-binding protein
MRDAGVAESADHAHPEEAEQPVTTTKESPMNRRQRRWLGAVACLVALTTVAACGGASTSSTGSSSGGSSKTVRLGALYLDNQGFYGGIRKGIEQGAGDQSIKLLGQNSSGDAGKESQFMSTLVGSKVDAIIMSPVSDTASVPVVRTAHNASIPVVCYNTCLADKDSKQFVGALVTTDQVKFGRAVGDFAGDYFVKKGVHAPRIAILNCDVYQACRERKQGFKEGLTAKVPGAQFVADQAGFEPDKAGRTATTMITGDKTIDAFYATTDNGTIGALQGIEATKTEGHMVVFGSDMSVTVAKALLEKPQTLLVTNAQDPQEMGRVAVQQALKLVNGEKVAAFTTFIPAKIYPSADSGAVQGWLDAHKDGIP